MKYIPSIHYYISFVLLLPLLAQAQGNSNQATDDSLTRALCRNQEQIVAQRSGEYRIEFYMGDTQLNMKTMRGFLSLNSASNPYYKKFRAQRVSGIACVIGGIGLMVADRYISQPKAPISTLVGIATSISGVVIFVRSNNKFRLAIYHYNRDICNLK
jgi:hypothetical protein